MSRGVEGGVGGRTVFFGEEYDKIYYMVFIIFFIKYYWRYCDIIFVGWGWLVVLITNIYFESI